MGIQSYIKTGPSVAMALARMGIAVAMAFERTRTATLQCIAQSFRRAVKEASFGCPICVADIAALPTNETPLPTMSLVYQVLLIAPICLFSRHDCALNFVFERKRVVPSTMRMAFGFSDFIAICAFPWLSCALEIECDFNVMPITSRLYPDHDHSPDKLES